MCTISTYAGERFLQVIYVIMYVPLLYLGMKGSDVSIYDNVGQFLIQSGLLERSK